MVQCYKLHSHFYSLACKQMFSSKVYQGLKRVFVRLAVELVRGYDIVTGSTNSTQAANVILKLWGQHTNGDDNEDSYSYIKSLTVQKERAMNERMIQIYSKQAEIALWCREEVLNFHEEIKRYTKLQPCLLFPQKAESPQKAEKMGLVTLNPLIWWKEHQQEYPRLF